MFSADHGRFAGQDIVNQIGFAGNIVLQNCIAKSNTVFPVGIASAKAGKFILTCKHHGTVVGIQIFAGIVTFYEIKFTIDIFAFPGAERIENTQELFTAGMGRTQDATIVVDNFD